MYDLLDDSTRRGQKEKIIRQVDLMREIIIKTVLQQVF